MHRRFAPLLAARVRRSKLWPALEPRYQLDDVVQEVWARVIPVARKSFRPSGAGSFLAFLGTLCDRCMVDLARRGTARKRGEGEQPHSLDARSDGKDATPAGGRSETPTSHARCSELEEIARTVLGERELAAWEQVELQDYTAPEAGLALDCSDAAVRGLLLRARAKLVLRLGGD